MQCSQISGKTNIFLKSHFLTLLIMRTMKQKILKISICNGLCLYTKKYYPTYYIFWEMDIRMCGNMVFPCLLTKLRGVRFFNNYFFSLKKVSTNNFPLILMNIFWEENCFLAYWTNNKKVIEKTNTIILR